jgi:hypothetical protein
MTIFELVKIALDELYKEAVDAHGTIADAEIQKKLTYLSSSYAQLDDENRTPVKYKDPTTRFAYVYKYVTSHADYVVQVLEDLRMELGTPIFQNEIARVACIGGGPGSDLIATLKYIDKYKNSEKVKKLTCHMLDREQAWGDTWSDLSNVLDLDINLSVPFQQMDVTDESTWAQQKKFLQSDLFTLSYFVSEVQSLDKDGVVAKFFKTLFQEAKSGALFLYDDNGTTALNTYFDELWRAEGLECITKKSNSSMQLNYSEEKSDLGEYLKKFNHSPKLSSKISYRVLRKP